MKLLAEGRTPYVLTRGSRPEVVMISYDDYLRFQALQEEEVLARFDALTARLAARNAAFSDAEVSADVEAARAEVDR